MKKKLIAVIILAVVLSSVLISCNLVTTNGEKDYHQIIAQVNYEGLKDVVYKGEVRNYYNAYGYIYTNENYYGMSEEEALQYFYDSLTRQKLLLLKAEVELAKSMNIDYMSADFKIEDLLTPEEIRYCILRANSEYKTQWNNYITNFENEQNANTEDDEDEEEDKDEKELEPRNVRTETTPSTDFEEGKFLGEKPEYFATWYDKQIASKQSEINGYKQEIKEAEEAGNDVTELNGKLDAAKVELKNMKNAYKSLTDRLKENYTDFDKTLQSQYENRVREKYEEMTGKSVTLTDEEYDERVKAIVDININDYKKASDYETAYNGNKTIIKHSFKGYFNVRSILFKFTDEQTKYLSMLSNLVGGKEDITIALREYLALGVSETAVEGALQDIADRFGKDGSYNGMTVNISNPDYDSDDSDSVAYSDKDVSYADILAAMIKYIADKKSEFTAKVKELNGEEWATANAAAIERYAIDEAFTDLIYMVNDDDGMFSSDFYTVSADGQDTSYVEEYAVLARRLYKESDTSKRADIGTMQVKDKGSLLYSSVTGNTALESKYLTNVAGTEYKLYLSKKKASTENDEIEANVYTFETSLGSISFIVNTYGIQMIMIDGYAFDEEEIGKSVEESNGVYTIKDNYVYTSEIKVEYEIEDDFSYKMDDDGKKIIASVELESKTFKEYLTETMLENKKSAIYNYDVNIFVKDQEKSIVKKDKVFNALKKDLID